MTNCTEKRTRNSKEKMTYEKMEQMSAYYVKPSELFEVLRISDGKGYELISQKAIPSFRYGKAIRIKRTDALNIIKNGIPEMVM